MYGLVNLARHHEARHIEKAAAMAKQNGLRSSKALRRMVESISAEAAERKTKPTDELTQVHPLIRSGEDYATFWDLHAAQAEPVPEQAQKETAKPQPQAMDRVQLRQVWQHADWRKVIDAFQLSVDGERRSRDDEIWILSPFTQEQRASMHVSLSENVYKDFSSGKGGGIIQFCREIFKRQGRDMSMFEVAEWMVAEGISTPRQQSAPTADQERSPVSGVRPTGVRRPPARWRPATTIPSWAVVASPPPHAGISAAATCPRARTEDRLLPCSPDWCSRSAA